MLADAYPELPRHETVADALLVAGKAALDVMAPDMLDARRPDWVSLRRSGVRQPDGSVVRLAASSFRHRRFLPQDTDSLPTAVHHIPGLSIFGGVIGAAFGHQTTQSVGRFWAAALAPDAPILFLQENTSFGGIPGHFFDLARSLGVHNDLRLVTDATLCEQLLVPEDTCNLDLRHCTTPFFRRWLADQAPQPQAAPGPDIYVSRSRLALDNGQFLQEQTLEQALTGCGYRVIHPEQLSIAAQLDTYASARRLIFADGSAAHLWSFAARPDQKVAVVLRRPRDRKFARWFRSFDAGPPAYLDHGIADFWRRGDGPTRSVALLDLQALWEELRTLGFHDATTPIGRDRAELEAWLSRLVPPRLAQGAVPSLGLDPRSQDLLGQRSRFGVRHSDAPADAPADTPEVPSDDAP